MAYTMKKGNKKNNTCTETSPMKGLFGGIGKALGGLGKMAGGAAKAGMMGPLGIAAGKTGLFMKDGKKSKY